MIKKFAALLLLCASTVVSSKETTNEDLLEKTSLTCYTDEGEMKLCLTLREGEVKCGRTLNDMLGCDNGRLTNLHSHCMTYDEDGDLMEIGKCVFSTKILGDLINYNVLPEYISELNSYTCGKDFRRNGTLCGKCSDGYYPLAYSYDMTCVECPNGKYNWWKYVLAAFLPLTVFYILVLFFRINVTSSYLHGFVLFSQCTLPPVLVRPLLISLYNKALILNLMRCFVTFYTVWNLDFIRPFHLGICLGTDTLPTLALDLAVGVYPLLLIFMTYLMIKLYDRNFTPLLIIWKPFNALFGLLLENVDIRTSLIDSFATFFLLSSMKFLFVAFDLLVPVTVYQVPLSDPFNVTVSWRLYYDATIPYLGENHLPYAILAIAVLVIFVLFPMFLIFLYPFHWFHKLLSIFPIPWYILHTFVDAFLGCYKDGTEQGTCDCRWFASMFIQLRLICMLMGAITLSEMFFVFSCLVLITAAIVTINVEPFKVKMKNNTEINVMFLFFQAAWYLCVIGIKSNVSATYTFLYIPVGLIVSVISLLYISAVTIHWIFSHRMFGWKVFRQLQAWRHGYDFLDQ